MMSVMGLNLQLGRLYRYHPKGDDNGWAAIYKTPSIFSEQLGVVKYDEPVIYLSSQRFHTKKESWLMHRVIYGDIIGFMASFSFKPEEFFAEIEST